MGQVIELFKPGGRVRRIVQPHPEPEDEQEREDLRKFRKYRAKRSPAYFINEWCMIADPIFGVMRFTLWGFQKDMLRAFLTERLHVILKARQLGMTWLTAAYLLWVVLFYPSKVCLVLSIREREAKKFLGRVKFMYRHLPEWMVDHVQVVRNDATVLVFLHEDGTESKVESMPVTEDAGRSETAAVVVMDEWAVQRWQDEIYTAIKPTISAGGQFIGLSTAKGFGNLFHRIWVEAPENGFTTTFMPWSARPDRDQAWYDRETGGMLPALKAQEFPSTPEEAFVQTGNVVFTEGLDLRADNLTPIPHDELPTKWLMDGLTVWRMPKDKERFVIGADVAEGVQGLDWSAAVVLDVRTGEQVAELHGYWPPHVYAGLLERLGYLYNTAIIAPERNNHGHSVINTLWHQKGYPQVYRHKDYDKETGSQVNKPGWPTTPKTKPVMIADLEEAVRMAYFRYPSPKLLSEFRVYSYLDDGTMGAQDGYHDDLVMATAIAWQVRKYRPYKVKFQRASGL